MTSNEKESLIKKIREELHNSDTILFLGSGISVWAGLPNWSGMIEELACFVEKAGGDSLPIRRENSSPLLAASYGAEQLSDQDFRSFIRSTCRVGHAEPHKIHRMIAGLTPTSFITTNYDHLLEEALHLTRPYEQFQKITNRQSIDCHAIMHATSRNFVLKLHGDIDDAESIILTSEQYNKLYSERSYAIRALEIFLSSRTIVFLGYSLRDPDFLHAIQALAQIYQRNNRITHYAIMPDVTDTEREYWWKNYGIKVLPFYTEVINGSINYGGIFPLLESLEVLQKIDIKAGSKKNACPPTTVKRRNTKHIELDDTKQLALIRYASAFILRIESPSNMVYPLSALLKSSDKGFFYCGSIDKIFEESTVNFVLTGSPGAGKSFSLKRYCCTLAYKLRNWGLDERHDPNAYLVPIYIDLKYYDGNIKKQIDNMFSSDISADSIIGSGKAVLIFDSFNEVSQKYLDNGICLKELQEYLGQKSRVIIGARFDDPFMGLNLHSYKLMEIEHDFIEDYLEQQAILPANDIPEEIVSLLQKPLFFRLLQETKITINEGANAKSLYTSYFMYLSNSFEKEFGYYFDFFSPFKELAYQTIESGQETFSLASIIAKLKKQFGKNKCPESKIQTIVNWLAEKQNFISPATKKQLSFFHQSVTEYLAASVLADNYIEDSTKIERYLKYTRWDPILLYATEFLQDSVATEYVKSIFKIDSIVAIRACSYLDSDSEYIISMILAYLLEVSKTQDIDYFLDIEEDAKQLPVTISHTILLRMLLQMHDIYGGLAAHLLYRLFGNNIKDELIQEMFDNIKDFNYLQELGSILAKHMTLEEYNAIIKRLSNVLYVEEKDMEAASTGFCNMANELPIQDIIKLYQPFSDLNIIQRNILCEILYSDSSHIAFRTGIEMVKLGFKEAVFPLYIMLKHEYSKFSYDIDDINPSILPSLEIMVQQDEERRWCIMLIKNLSNMSLSIRKAINSRIVDCDGILKLVYLYAAESEKEFILLYIQFLEKGMLTSDIISGLDEIDLHKFGDLIIKKMIWHRDFSLLVDFLDEHTYQNRNNYVVSFLLAICLVNLASTDIILSDAYGAIRIGDFLANHMDKEVENSLIEYFHTAPDVQRRFLAYCVFKDFRGLKLEQFTPYDIDFLVDDLRNFEYARPLFENGMLLSSIATETFVEKRLLPLLSEKNNILQANLKMLLPQIGREHSRRYINR